MIRTLHVVAIVLWCASMLGTLAQSLNATPRSAQEPTPYDGAGEPPALTGVPRIQRELASSGAPPSPAAEASGPLLGVSTPGTLDPRVGREGDIAHSGSRSHYVAIPLGPGIRIRVCGPAACIETTSTDAGPNRAMLLAGRIMDLDIGKWERVCGMPARYGLCPGSWVRVTGPRMTLPPTSTLP